MHEPIRHDTAKQEGGGQNEGTHAIAAVTRNGERVLGTVVIVVVVPCCCTRRSWK